MIRRRAAAARARGRRAVQVLRGHDPVPQLKKSLARTEKETAELRRRLDALEARTAEVKRLRDRVTELEADLDEQRGLSVRVAELSDAIAHLLAVAARGDQQELERTVAEFADGL